MTARVVPLTDAARGIWLGQALHPTSRAYWTAEYLELNGPLDQKAFAAAVDITIREAETLHQRIVPEGEQLLSWTQVPDHVQLPVLELGESEARDRLQAQLPPVPNLRTDPLYALELIRVNETRHLFHLRVHHLALDGTGYGLVYQRLFECYCRFAGGSEPTFEPRPLSGLVDEEAEYRRSPAYQSDRAHYNTLLADTKEPASLQAPRPLGPRPRVCRSVLGADAVSQGLQNARQARLEPAALLLAALACWLTEKSGEEEHVLGLAVAGRFSLLAAKTPCMAMNIVPVRIDVRPSTTFVQLARSVQEQLRNGRRHQRYRYEDLRTDCTARGVARPFGVVLNYMPFEPPARVAGLQIERRPLAAGPVEDLAFSVVSEGQGWRCDLEGHPDAYDESRLSSLQASWLARLSLVLANPDRQLVDLLGTAKIPSRLVSQERVEALDVLTCLEQHARQRPRAPAIAAAELVALDYGTLLSEVQRSAGALIERGVPVGGRVALLLRRSPDAIVAQLAALWVGAAYVPVDPDGPAERIRGVLDDALPALLVVEAADSARLGLTRWPSLSPTERGPEVGRMLVGQQWPAYLVFTSGSTGKPNGVVVSRGALWHFTAAALQRYGINAEDRVLQFSPLQFDASVEEIHLTLACGATLVLRTDEMLESLPRFALSCERLGLSVLDLPTAFWHELVDAPSPLPRLEGVRLWIIGGEAVHPEKAQRHFERFGTTARLVNSYGPTETTVVCASAELRPCAGSGPVPIGAPLASVELLVLDAEQRVVERGRPGQLAVLGPTLANGYFGREKLTSERFIDLVEGGQSRRAYLTGDRVVVGEAEQLVFLGRFDDELKLSGHRVQPLEVELAVSQLAGVTECAVVVVRHEGRAQLAAFYVTPSQTWTDAALRSALRTRVHPAAIPTHIHRLERLPRDANGKVDRSRLRTVAASPADEVGELTEVEQKVAAAFASVLGGSVTSPTADFFALGGHSLSALQLASRLSRNAGFDVPISVIFEHTTVRALAQAVAAGPSSNDAVSEPLAASVILRQGQTATVFCVHPADGLAYCYWGLGAHWPDVRVIGLQPWSLQHPDVTSLEQGLDRHVRLIEELAPNGPLHLLGYSSGGGLALELAVRLRARGRDVGTLSMLDSFPSDIWQGTPLPTLRDALVSMLDDLDASPRDADGQLVSIESLYERLCAASSTLSTFDRSTLQRMATVALDGMLAYRDLKHSKWDGELYYFAASAGGTDRRHWRAWLPYLGQAPQVIEVPTFHLGMTQPGILQQVAKVLWPRLQNGGR